MDKKGLGIYGAPDRTSGAPDMATGGLRLTYIDYAITGSHFCHRTVPVMGSGSANATVDIYG